MIKNILIGVLIVVLIFSFRSCYLKNQEIKSSNTDKREYYENNQKLTIKNNKLGQQIATQIELVSTKDKALQKEILKNSKLKSVEKHLEIAREIGIQDIIIPKVPDTVFQKVIDSTQVQIGSAFKIETKWFYFKGTLIKEGFKLNKVAFLDSLIVDYGTQNKEGFFGFIRPEDNVVKILNVNPHASTTGMRNVTFIGKKAFYETNLAKIIYGILIAEGVRYGIKKL